MTCARPTWKSRRRSRGRGWRLWRRKRERARATCGGIARAGPAGACRRAETRSATQSQGKRRLQARLHGDSAGARLVGRRAVRGHGCGTRGTAGARRAAGAVGGIHGRSGIFGRLRRKLCRGIVFLKERIWRLPITGKAMI